MREHTMLYRFYDKSGVLLYVGITSVGPGRWYQHSKKQPWWHQVATATVEHFATREEAEIAEPEAIRLEEPIYNKIHNRKRRLISCSDAERALSLLCSEAEPAKEVSGYIIREWRGQKLYYPAFSIPFYIKDSEGRGLVTAHRFVKGTFAWVCLLLEYATNNFEVRPVGYQGCDLTELEILMERLQKGIYQESVTIADFNSPFLPFRPGSLSFKPGSLFSAMFFPKDANAWFVSLVLKAEMGDSAMADLTVEVIKDCAPHLSQSWERSFAQLSPSKQREITKKSIKEIVATVNDLARESVAA